jgi:hypothetical protein
VFWEETRPLKKLPLGFKLGLTAFLLIAGVGYLLGFTNIYLTYSPNDQMPGLSVADVRLAFYGSREGTKLEKAVQGGMRQYLASDTDFEKIRQWIREGGKESGFVSVQPVFAASCDGCHSRASQVGGVVTEDFAGVSSLLAQDSGMPISRLVQISHTHILAALPLIFLLCFVFSFSRFPQPVKGGVIVFSLLAIPADIGSWWLARFFAPMAPLVILGGVCLGLAFAALVLLSFYDLWLRKADLRQPQSAEIRLQSSRNSATAEKNALIMSIEK